MKKSENWKIIEKRWPTIGTRLRRATPPKSFRVVKDGPYPTLLVDGIHLGSSFAPVQEAELQAKVVPEGSSKVTVYGLGMGDLPRVLLRRSTLVELSVVLLNSSVDRCNIETLDHSDWLADKRVNLLTPDPCSEVKIPFAAIPSCLQLADETASKLRDEIVLTLSTPFIHAKHSEKNTSLFARLEENVSRVAEDRDVSEFFGKWSGETTFVIGAGPSLSECIPFLRKRSGGKIIAVDAALRPLLLNGICPDAVMVIDAHETKILPFFVQVDLELCSHTSLIYFPVVHPSVLDAWRGTRYVAYAEHPLYAAMKEALPKGCLFSSGSVIHPAVDLAVKAGAGRIVLMGADFAFTDGFSHAADCVVRQEIAPATSQHWVLNRKGERVPTSLALRGFLRDLERYLRMCSGVEFLNASPNGAWIEGTSYLEVEHGG